MKSTLIQKLFLVSFAILTTVAIITSCRKLDTTGKRQQTIDRSKRFLNVPADAPSAIKRIAETIRKQNNESKFLNWFAEKFGYPVWSKSPIFFPPSNAQGRTNHVPDTLAFIPLVQDGINQVFSFLACAIEEDSVKIRLLRGDSYPAYGKTFQLDTLSAETVAMQCMVLEYKIFGHDSYRVNDLELFHQSPAGTSNESRFIYLKDLSDSTKGQNRVNSNARNADYYVPMWIPFLAAPEVGENGMKKILAEHHCPERRVVETLYLQVG